jgi:hypothetical protein
MSTVWCVKGKKQGRKTGGELRVTQQVSHRDAFSVSRGFQGGWRSNENRRLTFPSKQVRVKEWCCGSLIPCQAKRSPQHQQRCMSLSLSDQETERRLTKPVRVLVCVPLSWQEVERSEDDSWLSGKKRGAVGGEGGARRSLRVMGQERDTLCFALSCLHSLLEVLSTTT